MAIDNFRCPSCGADVSYSGEEFGECPYCGSQLHFGELADAEELRKLRSENSEDVVTVVAGPRSFRVALNQLVVAIYGCEQYMDGELHDDVYGDLLENYVSSETYYLIP